MKIMNTKGRVAQTMGLVGATLFLSASAGIAGISANSELLDINSSFSEETDESSRLNYNNVQIRTGQEVAYFGYSSAYNQSSPGTYAKGYFGASDSETGASLRATWFANEPDSIKRSDSGASLSQSSFVGLFVSMYDSSSTVSRSAFVEDCSAKAKVKFKEDRKEEETNVKAAVSLKCPRDTWEQLGFNEQQIEQIETMLKSPKVKLNYKGEAGPGPGRFPRAFERFSER
ncbi:MAG: hypothetical protein AB8G23_20550 [Myxococcota bacterium]